MMADVIAGREVEQVEGTSYTYDELMGLTFKLVPEAYTYAEQADGTWSDMSEDDAFMTDVINAAETPARGGHRAACRGQRRDQLGKRSVHARAGGARD